MRSVEVAIPEDVLQLLRESKLGERPVADQVRVALAVHLLEEGVISIGRAAEIAGESRAAFEELLAEMGLPPLRYDLEDYQRERRALERNRPQAE
jgi:predicted HTH domain antitoxin